MIITRLEVPYCAECGFCGRETVLRYKVTLKKLKFDICTLCYEEQMEFKSK